MEILNKVNEAYKKAMLSKDVFTRDTLKLVKATFLNLDKVSPKETTEAEYMNALTKMVKVRRDNAAEYPGTEMAANDLAELAIIEQFVPKQLSEAEVTVLVYKIAKDNNLTYERKTWVHL